jgi:tetratricopeptide (TPR) repeat protein
VNNLRLHFAVVALLPLAAATVRAEEATAATDVSRAETYAAEAFEAYTTKDYDQAVALYRRALEASPSPDILYNLARIYDTKLKDRARAIEFYVRYAEDPGAEPARLAMVNERLAKLREIDTLAGADRRERAAAADRSGPRVPTRELPPPELATTQGGGVSTAQVFGIVVGSVGLAGIGVGTGFGLAARADTDIAHEACDGNACVTLRGVDAAKDAKRAATVSTVAFIAGGALLVGGAALLIFGPSESERDVAGVRVVPYAFVGAVGTQLAGRF